VTHCTATLFFSTARDSKYTFTSVKLRSSRTSQWTPALSAILPHTIAKTTGASYQTTLSYFIPIANDEYKTCYFSTPVVSNPKIKHEVVGSSSRFKHVSAGSDRSLYWKPILDDFMFSLSPTYRMALFANASSQVRDIEL